MGEIFRDLNEPPQSPAASPSKRPANIDLSRQIEQMVERQPVDRVRCVRVFGDFYRCNWWSRRGGQTTRDYDWGGLMTDHVRLSRFFKATLSGEGIVLEHVSPPYADSR